MSLPIVALVGRMNVGKSTLFNRLSSTVKSLTLDYAGVTRDVLRDTVEWQDKQFELVDTGGISFQKSLDVITEKVREQALLVIKDADVVVLIIDGSVGLLSEDREISRSLHKLGKKVIVAMNKADKKSTQEHMHEAYELGHAQVIALSAQHGTSVTDLLEMILALLPAQKKAEEEKSAYNVMLLGRPNVGKSSLMNALLQSERSIVSEVPGTTREPITEAISFYKQHLTLTDTPGIRRHKNVTSELETMMVKSAFHALKDSHIMLLLIDATEGRLADQDLKLAFYAFTEQYKALIIVINKTDIASKEDLEALEFSMDAYRHLIKKVPVVRISCKTGKNVGRILPLIYEVWQRYNMSIPASELKMLFMNELTKKSLMHTGFVIQLFDAFQVKQAPPTIALEVNMPLWVGPSQRAFFENLMRAQYDLTGVPVRFTVRKKS